jgi:hypothetical protein
MGGAYLIAVPLWLVIPILLLVVLGGVKLIKLMWTMLG